MTNLAPGLVWCRQCQTRTALSSVPSHRCPVCDPSQGNQVSQNAADELDRIDAVLAGRDTLGDTAAEWRADGSHQDAEPVVRTRLAGGGQVWLGRLDAASAPADDWMPLGIVTDGFSFTDGNVNDPVFWSGDTLAGAAPVLHVATIIETDMWELLRWLWPDHPVPDRLDAWEDDGGSVVASDDV